MTPEEKDDKVWQLLENQPETKVDPMFSSNVLRAVRLLESKEEVSFWQRLFAPRVLLPLSAAAAAIAVVAVIATNPDPNQKQAGIAESTTVETTIVSTAPVLEEPTTNETSEVEETAYIGSLLAFDDPGELDDEDIAALLF